MGFSGVHAIAIYKPGIEPSDIRTAPPFLSSPVARLPASPADQRSAESRGGAGHAGMRRRVVHAVTYNFKTPGKYLVICTFLPHFNVGMYGWVTVRDR